MNIKKYLRIILPILIALAVAGIWVVKNQPTATVDTSPSTQSTATEDTTESSPEEPTDQTSAEEEPAPLENTSLPQDEDSDSIFALSISELNLELLGTYELPIIIDFGADYCVPCQMMTPILAAIHEEMGERAFIKYVDVSEYPELATDFPISVIPTQVFINADGTPYEPSDEISASISFTMYSYTGSDDLAVTTHQGVLTVEELRLILADMGVS